LKRQPVGGRALALVGLLAVLTGGSLVFAGGVFGSRDLPPDAKSGGVQEADLRDRLPGSAEPDVPSATFSPAPSPTPSPAPAPTTGSPTPERTQPPRPPTVRATSAAPPPPSAAPSPISMVYQDFSSVSGLTFRGSAARSGSVLRLTTAVAGQAGAAWSRTPIDARRSFSTSFSMVMQGEGGDGLVFVLQSQGLGALGGGGGNLGYGATGSPATAVRPSVAIEFDVFDNAWDPDTNHNHVAITVGGDPTRSLDYGIPAFHLACGIAYNAWVDYDVSTRKLNVYTGRAGKPASPIVSATIDLPQMFGTGTVYAGFTGSTGMYAANQDVLSWRFTQA
jgi:hypothetical protein